jgi:hypothetical protein
LIKDGGGVTTQTVEVEVDNVAPAIDNITKLDKINGVRLPLARFANDW